MPPSDAARFAQEMREKVLVCPPSEWSMVPTAEYPDVYGVLVEWLVDDIPITVLGFCEGTASVYSVGGPCMIGGHTDEIVRREARALVKAAADFYEEASPAAEFPYPQPDRARVYLLTFTGVRVLDAELDAMIDGRSRYAGLFRLGWAVFHRYATLDEQDSPPEDGAGYRKEWSGAEGYVNCLLTSMSRGIRRVLTLSAAEPVPNLVTLAEGNADVQGWLAAQEFPYETMRSKDVIRALRRLVGANPLPFYTRRVRVPAIHATNDGGSVGRVFNVEISAFDRSAYIALISPRDRPVAAPQPRTGAL